MTPLRVAKVLFNILVTAAAIKAALGTLSRPIQGAGVPPSVRRKRLGQVSLEDMPDLDDTDIDYRELM